MKAKLYPPIWGARVSQGFGEHPEWYREFGLPGHEGIDYAVPIGTPVYAAHDGQTQAAVGTTYGVQVWVTGNGTTTVYAHLSKARPDGAVKAGDVIGYSGNTGRSTGPHLHFGLKIDGTKSSYKDWLDPELYFSPVTSENFPGRVSLHWQRVLPWAKGAHDALGSAWVKIVNPTAGGDPFPGRRKLLRFWTDDWDRALLAKGKAGGIEYINRSAPTWSKYTAWGYTVFELPNEPGCNSNEEIAALRDFTVAAVDRAHELGYLVCALNLPEGNPHDNGTGNPEVSRWKMQQLAPALARADYVGLHCYWCPGVEGPMGSYHAGRYMQNIAWASEVLGFIPRLLIGECGVDGLINGYAPYKSWKTLYKSPEAYAQDAKLFIREAEKRAYVEGLFFFTAGYEDPWKDYDHDERVVRAIADAITMPAQGEIERLIAEETQKHIIPLNPQAGFEREGAARGLLPASREFDVTIGSVTYRAQAYRHPNERDWQYIVYCVIGDWGNTTWIKRAN
jgi:hypothetical protein